MQIHAALTSTFYALLLAQSAEAKLTLVRCAWGLQLQAVASGECEPALCRHSAESFESHKEFIFASILRAFRSNDTFVQEQTHHRIAHWSSQCLFTTSIFDGTFCVCTSKPAHDLCSFLVAFLGDSTAQKMTEGYKKLCPPVKQKSPPINHVVAFNDATFHKLYLPFARERDRTQKNGDRYLYEAVPSLDAFKESIVAYWRREVSPRVTSSHYQLVYMVNDIVCDDAYRDEYKAAAEFLRWGVHRENKHPFAQAVKFEEIAHRRGVDMNATVSLTLDYYGGQFAAELSKQVLSSMHHFSTNVTLFEVQRGLYPAICTLTGDGRHYDLMGAAYYLFKVRLLVGLLT